MFSATLLPQLEPLMVQYLCMGNFHPILLILCRYAPQAVEINLNTRMKPSAKGNASAMCDGEEVNIFI